MTAVTAQRVGELIAEATGREAYAAANDSFRHMREQRHVVQFSGGAGSWAAAKRVVERFGKSNVVLLFADVRDEHPDLYRFLKDASENIGIDITTISDGRTPMEVMSDERLIGNSRKDPCSKILKRQLLDRWCRDNCDPKSTVRYIGIDWTEQHRAEIFAERILPWKCEAPLLWEPVFGKDDAMKWMMSEGIELPLLYRQGFAHNNCGGACIKAGQGQWAKLFQLDPERYKRWEEWEERMRATVGNHSILRDRRGGKSNPLTLRDFRLRVQLGNYDREEIGGCGCAL